MATVRIVLDTRPTSVDKSNKYPLVLRIGHKTQRRDIPFDVRLGKQDFVELDSGDDKKKTAHFKLKGVPNPVRKTKRIQKTYSEVDLWLDENKGEIKLWPINLLKETIERKFFNKQSQLSLLEHGAKIIYRFHVEKRYSTASSYEDALKIVVKFQKKLARKDDRAQIKDLYDKSKKDMFTVKQEYKPFDMPIKAFNVEFAKDFKTYLGQRLKSKNSINIHLRSLQAIINDAEKTYDELKGHKPLESFKKSSTANAPVVLTTQEIEAIRNATYPEDSSKFHVRNYFLFMFNNMGMNFYDIAIARVHQFDGERFSYTRKKTESEGDYFSIKQNHENLDIIAYYAKGKAPENYIFPIIPEDRVGEAVFKTKKGKLSWFNDNIKKIAEDLCIEKSLSSYTPRDTWTNLGLQMGIDIRKISSGLGHSSVEVTQKHYSQIIQEKILDEINAQITRGPELN
ncbi:phage integrase SAM-like domain-containing protein [Roseivirga pacifica]